MLFLVFFAITTIIIELDDAMDFVDIDHMDVPNTLDSVGVGEQLQVDLHDNGSVILEESQAITEVIAIDIQNNPIVGNDPKTIGPMLVTTRSGIQSAPTIIGTKLSTLESEVQQVPHQVSVGAIGDSLLPFLEPSIIDTYVVLEFGKPRIEPNPTQHFRPCLLKCGILFLDVTFR